MNGPHPFSCDIHDLTKGSPTFESFCATVDKPHLHSSKGHEDSTNDSLLYETCWEDSMRSSFSSVIHVQDPNITTSTQKDVTMYHSPAADQSDVKVQNNDSNKNQSDTRSDFVMVDTPQTTGIQGDKRSVRGSTSDQSTNSEFVIVRTPESTEYQNSSFDIISTQLDSSEEALSCDDGSEDAFLNISGTVDHENQTIIYTETPVRATATVEHHEDAIADDDDDTEETLTASVIQNASNPASNESNVSTDGKTMQQNPKTWKDNCRVDQQTFSVRKTYNVCTDLRNASTTDSSKTVNNQREELDVNGSNEDENAIVNTSNEGTTLDNLTNGVDNMKRRSDEVEQWLSSQVECEIEVEDTAEQKLCDKTDNDCDEEYDEINNSDLLPATVKDNQILERKPGQTGQQSLVKQTGEDNSFPMSLAGSVQSTKPDLTPGTNCNELVGESQDNNNVVIAPDTSTDINPITRNRNEDNTSRTDDQISSAVKDDNNNSNSIPWNPAVSGSAAAGCMKPGIGRVEMVDKQTQTDRETPSPGRIKIILQVVKDVTSWLWEVLTRLCHNIGELGARATDRLSKWFKETPQQNT